MKFKGLKIVLTFLCAAAFNANAGLVTVWGEEKDSFSKTDIVGFYDGLAGHSAQGAFGQLDTIDLTGTDLLWATQPGDNYTALELAAMENYLAMGGRIAFLGEHGTFAPEQNNRINAALSALGSSIFINNTILDSQFRSASVADGQILNHSLTAGVDTYEYAAFAPLTVGAGAEVLMIGEEQYNGEDSVMMAYQNIGAGSIFLITDQNVWDNVGSWGSFDNGRMFENLLSARTGAEPIPEPSALLLMVLGLFGLRKYAQKK